MPGRQPRTRAEYPVLRTPAVLSHLQPSPHRTAALRLRRGAKGILGLQVLCEDEITCRASVSLAKRIHRARFEEQATLEGFDFAAAPKIPAAQIRGLAALRWLHAGESVILYGPVGVGTTHIAQALGHLAIRSGAEARFLKTSRVLAHLAGGRADLSWDKRLRLLRGPGERGGDLGQADASVRVGIGVSTVPSRGMVIS